jgi:hypothetical protein
MLQRKYKYEGNAGSKLYFWKEFGGPVSKRFLGISCSG